MATDLTALAEAQADLVLWKKALRACASGSSYRIGTRMLTRVDVDTCLKMVRHYENLVARLGAGRRSGIRVLRPVTRDY